MSNAYSYDFYESIFARGRHINSVAYGSLSSAGDDYFENRSYSYSDSTNCYTGTLQVQARSNGRFELITYIGQCFGNNIDSFKYQDEIVPSITIDGIEYTNLYLLKSYYQTMYY